MREQYGRLRVGLLFVALGILVAVLNKTMLVDRPDDAKDLVDLVLFPIYYVGVVLIEASTWPTPLRPTPQRVSA